MILLLKPMITENPFLVNLTYLRYQASRTIYYSCHMGICEPVCL